MTKRFAIAENGVIVNILIAETLEWVTTRFPDAEVFETDNYGVGYTLHGDIWVPEKPSPEHNWSTKYECWLTPEDEAGLDEEFARLPIKDRSDITA